MYSGHRNPNQDARLEKMLITNLDAQNDDEKTFTVLYNPQSYTSQRSVKYSRKEVPGSDTPVLQFQTGSGETLNFELFFDTVSAGEEVGGDQTIKDDFKKNREKLFSSKSIDVRKYTRRIFDLTLVNEDVHRPPRLWIEWGSLQYLGYLASCTQNFTKFNSSGQPVRAVLNCQFVESWEAEDEGKKSLNSPDTTKFRTVQQGDSLWAMAHKAYGSADQWRLIADANGIVNPRTLRSGEMLALPALLK